ncbi:TPA: hypothetical protein MYO83_002561 [Klebsiella michiganensis]|nr:hypothetical protein [Klebsiella michiganensis]HCB1844109.1 hypothetical protein [Klebsiella oxytoca]
MAHLLIAVTFQINTERRNIGVIGQFQRLYIPPLYEIGSLAYGYKI